MSFWEKHEITEIHRLREMLQKAKIPYELWNRNVLLDPRQVTKDIDWGWQILVYKEDGECLISVVQGWGTYGYNADKLEIMGLLTPEESKMDGVAGWLTADDVFQRIERYWKEHAQDAGNEGGNHGKTNPDRI